MRVKVGFRTASRECYNKFCENYPDIHLTFRQWGDIIYAFNYGFRDYLLETGDRCKMPWGLGDFAISKKKRKDRYTCKDGHQFLIMPIDWKKTREKGKRVFNFNLHTDGWGFRWKWFNQTARVKYADIWYFKPSRVSSRLIKHYVTQGDIYQNKYQEWDLL